MFICSTKQQLFSIWMDHTEKWFVNFLMLFIFHLKNENENYSSQVKKMMEKLVSLL